MYTEEVVALKVEVKMYLHEKEIKEWMLFKLF
jgi:hypothetical protein